VGVAKGLSESLSSEPTAVVQPWLFTGPSRPLSQRSSRCRLIP